MTLMKSAPRRNSARTARRRFHGPSASEYIVPNIRPPGDVADTIRPHETMRGPSTRPSSTARRMTIASSSSDPTSRMVVTPLASSARQERARRRYPSSRGRGSSPLSGAVGPKPGARDVSEIRWVWQSMSAGSRLRPRPSYAPSGASPRASATSVIRPPWIATVACSSTTPEPGSIARTFQIRHLSTLSPREALSVAA